MQKHGIKIVSVAMSLSILFSALGGLTSKAQAAGETVLIGSNSSNINSSVLRLERQVGISIEQKRIDEEIAAEAEAQRIAIEQAEAAKLAAEKLAAQKATNIKVETKKDSKLKTVTSNKNNSNNTSIGQKVVSAAMTRIGIAYSNVVDGVTYDCSGLTQWAYKQAGVSLSRLSYTQVNDCVKISQGELQLGDLIFWQSGGKIDHVGIYAGGGMVIDASPHGVVKRAIFSTPSQNIACYGRPRY